LQNNFRFEAQSHLTAFLDAASGFYAHLLDELCTTFQVSIPCRVKSSKLVFLKGRPCGFFSTTVFRRRYGATSVWWIVQSKLIKLSFVKSVIWQQMFGTIQNACFA